MHLFHRRYSIKSLSSTISHIANGISSLLPLFLQQKDLFYKNKIENTSINPRLYLHDVYHGIQYNTQQTIAHSTMSQWRLMGFSLIFILCGISVLLHQKQRQTNQ